TYVHPGAGPHATFGAHRSVSRGVTSPLASGSQRVKTEAAAGVPPPLARPRLAGVARGTLTGTPGPPLTGVRSRTEPLGSDPQAMRRNPERNIRSRARGSLLLRRGPLARSGPSVPKPGGCTRRKEGEAPGAP